MVTEKIFKNFQTPEQQKLQTTNTIVSVLIEDFQQFVYNEKFP